MLHFLHVSTDRDEKYTFVHICIATKTIFDFNISDQGPFITVRYALWKTNYRSCITSKYNRLMTVRRHCCNKISLNELTLIGVAVSFCINNGSKAYYMQYRLCRKIKRTFQCNKFILVKTGALLIQVRLRIS